MSRGWRPFRNLDAFALFGCLVPVVEFFTHSSPAAATGESVGCTVPARGVLDDGGRTRQAGTEAWAPCRRGHGRGLRLSVSAVSAMVGVARCTVSWLSG